MKKYVAREIFLCDSFKRKPALFHDLMKHGTYLYS